MDFYEKVAVVTGGAMGIGQAIALAFAHKGARLAILDINKEAAEETCTQVRKAGSQCLVCEMDVSQDKSVDVAVAKTVSELGQIDILINNAGVSHPAVSILELEPGVLPQGYGRRFERCLAVRQKSGTRDGGQGHRRDGQHRVCRGAHLSSFAGLRASKECRHNANPDPGARLGSPGSPG